MGLDDRDYMRDRRRAEREAARLGSASWIDRNGRVEHHGLWFDGRYRSGPRVVPHPWQKWLFLLMALSILIPMYGEIKREGWLPDFDTAMTKPSATVLGFESCPAGNTPPAPPTPPPPPPKPPPPPPPGPPPPCHARLDIVVVLDGSGSIKPNEWAPRRPTPRLPDCT